ncbi:sigma-70 family RNA polymerase sigma factor [Niastella caeni]|uniref:Sigma-70 family RNA polymerase sigma factor n=1 Tax=Niastella caeni TaxID=2569763 RepID=A0A4V4H194_9BACT|nr:sigma-70 family RNA polymerase sigma factor [Niastella caeni]THU39616.1 sigma-70 family RNA polymerase sigma factor [Niastella caeni]
MSRTPFDSHNTQEDKSLIIHMRSGDYAAFTLLYNKYIRQLTQYGLKFLPDLPAVEDVLHDVFVWLWTNRQKIDIHSSVKSYLFKSVRTSMLHVLEKQHRLQSLQADEEHTYTFDLQLTPEALVLHNENRRLIRQQIENVLLTLTPKQKEVIYLRYYEGLNFEDIAQSMNLSVKACYKLMGRAIATLRENMVCSLLFVVCCLWFVVYSYRLPGTSCQALYVDHSICNRAL